MQRIIISFLFVAVLSISNAQTLYDNNRCKCVCPNILSVSNRTDNRNGAADNKLFIANVSPNLCNCDQVVLPKVTDDIKGREEEYCLRCDCKYENRNITTIKYVVNFVLVVLALLTFYMVISLSLEYYNTIRAKNLYMEQKNEEDDISVYSGANLVSSASNTSAQHHSIINLPEQRSNNSRVLDLVGLQKDKWRKNLKEQQRNIYDKHTILN